MIAIEKATYADIPCIMAVIAEAKAYMAEQGFSQWTEDYPDEQMFRWDVELGRGFVLRLDGRLVGVAALSYKEEACYGTIDGSWLSSGSYAVVHRLAVLKDVRGTGVAQKLLESMELRLRVRNIHSLRADTHRDNLPMQGLLRRAGFSYCGVVTYDSSLIPTGDPTRLAYEKLLTDGCKCSS